MDVSELYNAAKAFAIFRTVRRVASTCEISPTTAQKSCHLFRLAIASEPHVLFKGPTEVDETYIGGQRKNYRLHLRKLYPPKRGHGTRKLPIIGAYDRHTKTVCVSVIQKKLKKKLMLGFIQQTIQTGTKVYTDAFPYYREITGLGYHHEWVNHNQGEYVRGDVHTNGIEGFWGYMKRHMGTIGGMRRDRLELFAKELAWRYNTRGLTDTQKADNLVSLVERFGGRF